MPMRMQAREQVPELDELLVENQLLRESVTMWRWVALVCLIITGVVALGPQIKMLAQLLP